MPREVLRSFGGARPRHAGRRPIQSLATRCGAPPLRRRLQGANAAALFCCALLRSSAILDGGLSILSNIHVGLLRSSPSRSNARASSRPSYPCLWVTAGTVGQAGAMERTRPGHRENNAGLVVRLVVLAIAGGCALPTSRGAGQSSGDREWVPPGPVSAQTVPAKCSTAALASFAVTPAVAYVPPLETQVFTATAMSACGTPLTQNTTFRWWLSSASLGSLSSGSGTSIVYDACVAPMDGVLHVRASSGAVTLFADSSISVSGQQTSGPSPGSSPSTGSSGTGAESNSAGIRWAATGMVTFLLLAGAALLIGRWKPERKDRE